MSMLRIAVPNKGSLSEAASTMLQEAGYRKRRDTRELVMVDEANNVEFFFLRPRDIAVYVAAGTLDVGITGRDLFRDARTNGEAEELMSLGFGRSTFRFAGPAGKYTSIDQLEGKRLATSYDGLLKDYLAEHNINVENVVRLDGAVESSIRLGVADVIADVVETGNTLRAAGMDTFGEPILVSEAVVIGRKGVSHRDIDTLLRRLQSVLVARQYVLMDYNIPRELAEEARELTPGFDAPTMSPLQDESWVAMRVMVRKEEMNMVMDQLHTLGARAILVSAILATRI